MQLSSGSSFQPSTLSFRGLYAFTGSQKHGDLLSQIDDLPEATKYSTADLLIAMARAQEVKAHPEVPAPEYMFGVAKNEDDSPVGHQNGGTIYVVFGETLKRFQDYVTALLTVEGTEPLLTKDEREEKEAALLDGFIAQESREKPDGWLKHLPFQGEWTATKQVPVLWQLLDRQA
jgi:hypothetical protein